MTRFGLVGEGDARRDALVPVCFLESTTDTSTCVEEVVSDGLALQPVSYAGRWNGYAVPVVTARAFADFVAAHMRNDHGNGTWGEVFEIDIDRQRYLVHAGEGWLPPVDDNDRPRPILATDDLDGADYWPAGEAGLYALDGWVWLTADDSGAA